MLQHVVSELQTYLNNWYAVEVRGKKNVHALDYVKGMEEFFKLHPDWEKYRRHIFTNYSIAKSDHYAVSDYSHSPLKAIVNGIIVEAIDYKRNLDVINYKPRGEEFWKEFAAAGRTLYRTPR